ncbi:hypothetical protein TNCV_164271 [Trichonephila clavipes]|nr:hypothetical protein TNCV_164271 [Trichonephila clavipes]
MKDERRNPFSHHFRVSSEHLSLLPSASAGSKHSSSLPPPRGVSIRLSRGSTKRLEILFYPPVGGNNFYGVKRGCGGGLRWPRLNLPMHSCRRHV